MYIVQDMFLRLMILLVYKKYKQEALKKLSLKLDEQIVLNCV